MNFLDTLERVKIKVNNLCLQSKNNAQLPLIEKNIKSTQES